MARCNLLLPVCASLLVLAGCVSNPHCVIHGPDATASVGYDPTAQQEEVKSDKEGKDNKDRKEDKKDEDKEECPDEKKASKTIFEWSVGKEEKNNGNGGAGENGDEEDRIVTDRPDFTEASSTVGKGRIQLEAGYTFTRDVDGGNRLIQHSYPEMLWRIGLFADWFELRVGQNFDTERRSVAAQSADAAGAEDLYLGVKLALTEQKKCLPETGIILALNVPTGTRFLSSGEVDPQVDFLFGWDIIKDCLDLGGGLQFSRTREPVADVFPFTDQVPIAGPGTAHPYLQIAPSLTVGYTLTPKLHAYTEGYAFLPHSALDPDVGPEYYFDGGFTYLVTNNFQLDIRAGVGLNRHADDFFAGSGFSVRY